VRHTFGAVGMISIGVFALTFLIGGSGVGMAVLSYHIPVLVFI